MILIEQRTTTIMKLEFLPSPSDPAPAVHEAALLDVADGLRVCATAWREGTTVTLRDPRHFLDLVESHIAALNAHVRNELMRTACRPLSILNCKE
jgi:hypothetical protein